MWWWIDNETASDSDSEKELPDNIIDQRNLYDLRLKEIRHYIDNYCDRSELFWISEYPPLMKLYCTIVHKQIFI